MNRKSGRPKGISSPDNLELVDYYYRGKKVKVLIRNEK